MITSLLKNAAVAYLSVPVRTLLYDRTEVRVILLLGGALEHDLEMMFLLLCLYAAQPHAVAQATPAELIAAIYAEHNPGKLDAMASLLEKYAGHEQQLLESVMQKYGIVEPPSISILDGGASPDEDDLVSVEADTTATAAPAAAEQGEGATEQLEGAMDPNLPPEDRMVALLETQLGDNLMKIASRLGRKLQDLRTRPPVEAGREVRQAAVASYLKDLAEFVEPRPTLALFGDTATQVRGYFLVFVPTIREMRYFYREM
eukprot:SAG31_NODE_139_length_22847_cov_8.142474_4_plen_259_part_00